MAEASPDVSLRLSGARDSLMLISVVVVGLTATGLGMWLAWGHLDSVMDRRLGEAAREVETQLSREAAAVETFVETVAAFVESSQEVTKIEFDSFVGRTAGRWPGLVAVEWQAWVPAEKRAGFEAAMQADQPGFRIVERDGGGRLVPVATRPVHLPVVHVFNMGVSTSHPGLDLAASREWFEAKIAAIPAPHAVASPSFGIVTSDGRGIGEGFSISDSVLASGTGPARERLQGFVSAVFAYRPLIRAATAGTGIERLHVTVRDAVEISPVYFSWEVGEAEHGPDTTRRVVSTVEMAGRTWEVTIAPRPELFAGLVPDMPWYVLGFGFLATAVCGVGLCWRQRAQRERESQVGERVGIERRFHDIVDRMSGAVIVVRAGAAAAPFPVVEFNAPAAGLIGRPRETIVGRPLGEVLSGAADSGLLAALERVRATGEVQHLASLNLIQGDRIRHLAGAVFRVGRGAEMCAVLQDLTELKTAESALREARDELELALDVSRVGLWSWDIAQRSLRLDVRCARLYGLEGTDVVDDAVVTSRIHPEDLKLIREEVERALSEMRSYEVEYRFTLADGTLRFLCSRARPVREPGGSGTKIVGCSWDVTERRRMEEHLRRTQRLESLGTLAGGVAHDLNNALAPVTMGLDLLKRRVLADSEAVESIKLMQTSVRRASSIVRQLIAFKRGAGESKVPSPVHPKRVLELLGTTLVESFPKEISVLIEPASLDLPRIVADEREVHQVLLNLCVNARDAMPDGGRLVVSCEGLELGAANQSQFPELRPGAYVLFCVADTGSGISPEIRHRVFDPFFTTKEVGKGSGLGLSTALGIVRAHRGGIQFESREGVGSTFRVLFPVFVDDEPSRTVPVVALATVAGEPARVSCLLLVDDEAQVRELARRALEQSGFKVMTAGNGREAVELFAQHVQAVDAVIMDLLMPVMNGAAATAAIKRIRPDIPIVGASGFATDALIDEAKAAGITTFLPKPFTVTILVEAVRAAMAQKKTG